MTLLQKQFTTLKKAAYKKQTCKKSSKCQVVWQSKARPSKVSLLDEDMDPAVEAHMSLTPITFDLDPIPLENQYVSWQREVNDEEWEPIPLQSHDVSWQRQVSDEEWDPIPLENHDVSLQRQVSDEEWDPIPLENHDVSWQRQGAASERQIARHSHPGSYVDLRAVSHPQVLDSKQKSVTLKNTEMLGGCIKESSR